MNSLAGSNTSGRRQERLGERIVDSATVTVNTSSGEPANTLKLTEHERNLLLFIGRDGLSLREAAMVERLSYSSARRYLHYAMKRNGINRDALIFWTACEFAAAFFRNREKSQSAGDQFGGLKSQTAGINSSEETGVSRRDSDRMVVQKGPAVEPARNSQGAAL